MIDLYEIRTMLLSLPQFSPSESTSASGTSYTRYIDRTVSRIESLLRIIMVPVDLSAPPGANAPNPSATAFIHEYTRLIGDDSFSNFSKILELKGLRRGEMNDLIELFVEMTSHEHRGSTGEGGADTNPISSTETSFLSTLDMDPPHGPLTPQPTFESSGGGMQHQFNNSHAAAAGAAVTAPYAVRNPSGVRSPDRTGALSPSNAEGGLIGGRVFGTGKFSSIFGLARRGDEASRR